MTEAERRHRHDVLHLMLDARARCRETEKAVLIAIANLSRVDRKPGDLVNLRASLALLEDELSAFIAELEA